MGREFRAWIRRQRSSTRLAFILQIACRIVGVVLNLIWTPLLLASMGRTLNGQFLSFQAVATLGGLGDLGMGGVVNIQTSRLLGRGEERDLQTFLASARALFLLLAVVVTGALLVLAPWLPGWLKFEVLPGAGSLTALFTVGAVGAGLLIVGSYFTNLNYGCSNLTWPVVPVFLFFQGGLLVHWLLARQQAPLWIQYLPYVGMSLAGIAVGWGFMRLSFPALSGLTPLSFERSRFAPLLRQSGWVYLYSLCATLFSTTDRLFINAGFGASEIPLYLYNSRLCELALFVISSASLASLPKITQWIHSPDPGVRDRGLRETLRLNRFQTFLGCAAAVVYLAVNDYFMAWWLGPEYRAPLLWQVAFAAYLAVTAAGFAGFDLAARCADNGIRFSGIMVGLGGALKLVLSFAALYAGSIAGIALATVLAQSLLVLVLGRFSARHLRATFWQLSIRGWLLALAAVGVGTALRIYLPLDSLATAWVGAAVAAVAIWLMGWIAGIRIGDLREEWGMVRALIKR